MRKQNNTKIVVAPVVHTVDFDKLNAASLTAEEISLLDATWQDPA